jgi:hypothetical protein
MRRNCIEIELCCGSSAVDSANEQLIGSKSRMTGPGNLSLLSIRHPYSAVAECSPT